MITIWGRDNSTNVKKVLWCLEELQLPYRAIPAGGKFGIVKDAQYLAMNPNALVPCLQDDTTALTLWESNTIVRYLVAQYGKGTLWQEEPAMRARGEKWMDWVISSLATPYSGVFINLIRTAPELRDQQLIDKGIIRCNELMAMVDAELAQQEWLGGNTFSSADIALGPFVYSLFNLDVERQEHPHLRRWYQQLTMRPAFQKMIMTPLT